MVFNVDEDCKVCMLMWLNTFNNRWNKSTVAQLLIYISIFLKAKNELKMSRFDQTERFVMWKSC